MLCEKSPSLSPRQYFRMKKTIFSLLCFLPLWAAGQSLSIEALHDRVSQSLRYRQDLVQAQLRLAELGEIRANRIPVFYLDANLQRNLIIPTTPVPAIAFNPDARDGEIIPLQFATRWSSRAGIQLEWQLFDPKRTLDEKEQALSVRQAEITTAQNAQDWKREATLAYAAVVLATQQLAMAQQDSAAYAQIVEVSRVRYAAGRELSSVYYAAEQEFERKQIQLHEAWAVLLEADLELSKYTDLSQTQSLSSSIDDIRNHAQTQQKQNYNLQLLALDQARTTVQYRGLRRQLLPSVTLNAYWGEQYFDNDFRIFRGDSWFGNSFVNVALRVPISAYLTAQPTLRRISLQTNLTTLQMDEEERLDSIQHAQQAVKVEAALQKVARLKRIATLAHQVKEEQEASYLAGRLLLSDYNEAAAAYVRAEKDVWQAEYDLIAVLMEL